MPGGHGVRLHDLVGVLAGDARVDEGEKDLGGVDEPLRLVEVGHHLGGIEDEAVDDANEALEHVVEGDEAVRLGDALRGRVRDVALVPEGHVVEGHLRVGLDHAREAADLLDGDGVALVRHRRAALLPLAERLLGLEGVGALEVPDLGGDALAAGGRRGEDAGEVGVVVARDDLRGERVVHEAEVLAHVLLDARVDARVGSHRTRDRAEGHVVAGVAKPVEVALELPGPAAELHAKGHGLGVDAVGPAHAEGVSLLECATLADLAELAAVLDEDVGGLDELVAEGRVAKVRARHAVVDPAAGLGLALRHVAVDVGAHVGEEGDDVVVGHGLDGVDLILVEGRVVANPPRLVSGDAALADLGVRLAGEHLDLLPDGVLVLERKDMTHLRTGVAIDHRGSFRGGAERRR